MMVWLRIIFYLFVFGIIANIILFAVKHWLIFTIVGGSVSGSLGLAFFVYRLIKSRKGKIRVEPSLTPTKHLINLSEQLLTQIDVRLNIPNFVDTYLLKTDTMEGGRFQDWCAELLNSEGYSILEKPPKSGDMGVDIVVEKDAKRYAVQCKRSNSPIGQAAVREVVAGKAFYKCQGTMVITNSTFAKSTEKLAEANQTVLLDRNYLENALRKKHERSTLIKNLEGELNDKINQKRKEWAQILKCLELENVTNAVQELLLKIKNKAEQEYNLLKRGSKEFPLGFWSRLLPKRNLKKQLKSFKSAVEDFKRRTYVFTEEINATIQAIEKELNLELGKFLYVGSPSVSELEQWCRENLDLLSKQPECLDQKCKEIFQEPESCLERHQEKIKEIAKKLEEWEKQLSSLRP